jgi:hypothetical protein
MGHGRTLEYPKTPINKVNRYNQRGELVWEDPPKKKETLLCHATPIRGTNSPILQHLATYDLEQIHTIINTSTVVHVSFNTPDPANPFPVTLPVS